MVATAFSVRFYFLCLKFKNSCLHCKVSFLWSSKYKPENRRRVFRSKTMNNCKSIDIALCFNYTEVEVIG